jgi:hypothetical protein
MSCLSHPCTSLWDPTQPGIGQPHSEHQQYSKLQYLLLAEPGQGPSCFGPDLPRTSLTAVHIQRCPQPAHLGGEVPATILLDARSVPGPGVSSLTQLLSRSTHGATHPLEPPGPGDPLIPPWTPSRAGWIADPGVGRVPCSASLASSPADLVARAVAVTHQGSHRWGRAASPFQAAIQPNHAAGWGRRGLGPANTALTNERLHIAPHRRGPWPMG